MDNIKIVLTVTIPGATMFNKEECTKNKWVKVPLSKNKKKYEYVQKEVYNYDNLEKIHFELVTKDDKGKKTRENYTALIRKNIPAKQTINISEEAYYSYIDKKEVPSFIKPFIWQKMSKKERLEAHLKDIATGLNGEILNYHIFED